MQRLLVTLWDYELLAGVFLVDLTGRLDCDSYLLVQMFCVTGYLRTQQ